MIKINGFLKAILVLVGFVASAWVFKLPYVYPYLWLITASFESAPVASGLPNPLPGQRFADTWGAPRSGGRKHEGVDIFAKRGTPIYSTTDGVVTRIGQNRLGGNVVYITGAGRIRHYYAHLDTFAEIKKHQWIKAGTVIGYVGDSGNAQGTPPHLHYGIYTISGAINPFPLIKQ